MKCSDGEDWCREPLPANEYGCDRNILLFAQTAESGTDWHSRVGRQGKQTAVGTIFQHLPYLPPGEGVPIYAVVNTSTGRWRRTAAPPRLRL